MSLIGSTGSTGFGTGQCSQSVQNMYTNKVTIPVTIELKAVWIDFGTTFHSTL